MKDACSLKITKEGINYKIDKVPLDLQEYISGLTKLVVVKTNVPRLVQVVPKMVRAVIKGVLLKI